MNKEIVKLGEHPTSKESGRIFFWWLKRTMKECEDCKRMYKRKLNICPYCK